MSFELVILRKSQVFFNSFFFLLMFFLILIIFRFFISTKILLDINKDINYIKSLNTTIEKLLKDISEYENLRKTLEPNYSFQKKKLKKKIKEQLFTLKENYILEQNIKLNKKNNEELSFQIKKFHQFWDVLLKTNEYREFVKDHEL